MAKDTKERILSAALDMFSRNGYAGANIRELSLSLGLVKSGVYKHFESTEEIWNGIGSLVYPPARDELAKHGIGCEGQRAVQLTRRDYDHYDYLLGMDSMNIRNMKRMTGHNSDDKIKMLLEFAGEKRSISDPWYYGHFDITYKDIVEGCEAFLEYLYETGQIY